MHFLACIEPLEHLLHLLNLAILNHFLLYDLSFISDAHWRQFAFINYELESFPTHLTSLRANAGAFDQVHGARVGLPDKLYGLRGPSG